MCGALSDEKVSHSVFTVIEVNAVCIPSVTQRCRALLWRVDIFITVEMVLYYYRFLLCKCKHCVVIVRGQSYRKREYLRWPLCPVRWESVGKLRAINEKSGFC
jgi:hypothetical protein